jgi:endoglucanase
MKARPRSTRFRLLIALVATVLSSLVGVVATSAPARAATNQFRGMNWAVLGDNFSTGPLVIQGLSRSDSNATVRAKANAVYDDMAAVGINTVRLPINTHTVADTTWWNAYRGAIDAATARGFKVILAYWEDGAASGGRITNLAAWNTMWSRVTYTYGANTNVYFEPMNEPHGYTETEWADIAAKWLDTYPSVPRNRVFVSGAGYNDHVTSVCADPRLDGTYLSLHHYGFWKDYATYDQWVADLKERIGDCANRTVADEFGAPMTTGLNYNKPAPSNNYINYVQAVTDTFRELKMGSVYWPGLRTDDTYTLQTLTGDPARPGLATTNQSGADRLAWGWGRGKPVQP